MTASQVLSVPCLPSLVSLSGGVRDSGLVCEWWCPSLRSFLCLVSLHLSPFICLPFAIAYDRAVRTVRLRNMMSEPFPRSSLQFFKPDVLAVVLAGCAGHSCGLIALIPEFENLVIVIAIVIVIVTVIIIVICYH